MRAGFAHGSGFFAQRVADVRARLGVDEAVPA
jgi:hypothetical protein